MGIVTAVTYFHARQMVSDSRLNERISGVFGLTVSEGAIANMLRRAARPFADTIAQIVRASLVIASDVGSGDGGLSDGRADARQARAGRVPRRG